MPRHNNRRRNKRPIRKGRFERGSNPGFSVERALGGFIREETHPDGVWSVRNVAASTQRYLCPGCQQWFTNVPHVVAWPAEDFVSWGGLGDRRHWHSSCWRARNRRKPPGATR